MNGFTSTGSGKIKNATVAGLKPILFILDPSAEKNANIPNQINDLEHATPEFLKLWVLNNIRVLFFKDINKGTLFKGRTNFEGCLILSKRKTINGKRIFPWAGLQSKKSKYQFFFSTIPLTGQPIPDLFNRYYVPFSVGGSGKDNYEIDKNKINLWRPYTDSSMIEFDYHVVKIPLSLLENRNAIDHLEYWQSIIYYNSQNTELLSMQPATQENINDIKNLLNKIRGAHVVGCFSKVLHIRTFVYYDGAPQYIDYDNKPVLNPSNLPFMIYDRIQLNQIPDPTIIFKSIYAESRLTKSEQGPVWLESDFQNKESADTTTKRLKQQKVTHLFKMNKSGDNLPIADPNFPSVRDSKFFKNFDQPDLNIIFRSPNYLEKNVKNKILSILIGISRAEFYTNFFIGYGDDWNQCLLNALEKAAIYWKYKIIYDFNDLVKDGAKKETLKKKMQVKTCVKMSFDTNTDAFTESLAPMHVYSQIKEWWNCLTTADKDYLLIQSDYITISGHASELGNGPTSKININLRNNRAEKTATSLWYFLKDEYLNCAGKRNLLSPEKLNNENQAVKVREEAIKDGKISETDVPIYYYGNPNVPQNIAVTPHGNTIVKLQNKNDVKIIEDAINTYNRKDNPNHRVAIITFVQLIPGEVEQLVSEKIRLTTADAIGAYRVLFYQHLATGSRSLVYVVRSKW